MMNIVNIVAGRLPTFRRHYPQVRLLHFALTFQIVVQSPDGAAPSTEKIIGSLNIGDSIDHSFLVDKPHHHIPVQTSTTCFR